MEMNFLNELSSYLGISKGLLIIILIWSAIWKAIGLWKSARLKEPIWFVLIFIINTMGLLEILYIFIFSKIRFEKNEKSRKSRKK